MANVYQIAHLNKLLPKGFKFELYDIFKKNDTSGSKKGKKHSVIPKNRVIFLFQNLRKAKEGMSKKLKLQKKYQQKLNKKRKQNLKQLRIQ